jgi:uncharacterized caspase-like protein
MADWALVIGINKYDRLRSLDYAERDAALMRDFFQNEARFEPIFYFSDTSPDFYAPDGSRQSTRPTYANLRSFLRDFFEEPYLKAGDNLWFFFSGHGIRHQDRDYLMPCDANPRDVDYTAISISYVTERLRRSGAGNVVLFLDACRNEGEKAGLGIGEEKQQGVITICSCSPKEKSYEIEEIEQGAFTYALLESLRIQGEGNCATVERLCHRLRYRVTEINRYYNKPLQTPYAIAEPASKYHLILLPKQATLQDIVTLKLDAQEAELKKDNKLAEQLWIRILALSPSDPQALEALGRIWEYSRATVSPQPPQVDEDNSSKRSNDTTPPHNAEPFEQPRQPTAPSPPPKVGNKSASRLQTGIPLKKPAIIPTNWKMGLIGLVATVMGISAVVGAGVGWRFPFMPEKTVVSSQEYDQLEELLKQRDWKQADQRTSELMLKAAGREQERWLDINSITTFPCEDLRTIDRLWVKYSDERFGFSVQKRIWESVGGKPGEYVEEIYQTYGDRVGWRVKGIWLDYSKISFSLERGAAGHLPIFGGRVGKVLWDIPGGRVRLFSRVETCKV